MSEGGEEIVVSTPPNGFRFALRAFGIRNYRILFWPQLLSLCGTWMQHTAQGWLVYRLSGSPGWLGFVTFLTLFPIFLFSLWAGAVGDRHPRKWIIWSVNLLAALQALTLGILTLMGAISVPLIACLAFFLGILNAFEIPTRQAFMLDLVPRQTLPSALALNSSAFNLARLIGPLIGGILIPWKGEGICFLVNVLTYLPVLVALVLIRIPEPVQPGRQDSLWRALKFGLAYVYESRDLKTILLLVGVTSFFGVWFPSFLPVFAQDIHHGGPVLLGLMLSAVGLGSLVGAYTLAKHPDIHELGKRVASGAIGFSVGLLIFANVASITVSILVLGVLGFSLVSLNVGSNTIIQALAPPNLRGRIVSFYTVSLLGVGPLGVLIAGSLGEWIGVPLTITLGSLGCVVAAIFLAPRVAQVRPPSWTPPEQGNPRK